MTGIGQRSALGALDSARGALEQLDISRHPEENAAALIELWSAVETALRSLLGGSALTGQSLIRELRQREFISLEQAHSLLELQAVRERVDRAEYQPTNADLQVAQEAFTTLERGLRAPIASGGDTPAPPGAPPGVPAPAAAEPLPVAPQTPRRRVPWLGIVLVIVALLLAGGGVYWYEGRSGVPAIVSTAIAEYQAGRRDAAQGDFARAAREHPTLALPHIYLARIARDQGDFSTAGSELKAAVELEPGNATALRELGAFFLARGTQFANQGRPDLASADYDAARRNYVKSIQLDPTDRTAQGYLGCALERQGRTEEAARWFGRAGPGPWSSCASRSSPVAP